MSLSQWWKEYGTYVAIGLAFIFFATIIYIRIQHPELFEELENTPIEIGPAVDFERELKLDVPSQRKRGESKGERICKEVAEKIFNKPFNKIRPDFLKNAVTGQNLELDLYNDELKLAIEYNGIQHYKFSPHFHKNQDAFQNQKYRDLIKEQRCREKGITLIVVPYLVKHEEIEPFIKLKCKELGLI